MPELAELEVLRREIDARVLGKEVEEVVVRVSGKSDIAGRQLLPLLHGAKVLRANRRGKVLTVEFSGDLAMMLIGQVRLVPREDISKGGNVFALAFSDGGALEVTQVALKNVALCKKGDLGRLPLIAPQGIDAFDHALTVESVTELVRSKRGSVKALLTDQSLIAGIGNTYADEILFAARINPQREARSLSDAEAVALYNQMKEVLGRAIELGGSSEEKSFRLDGTPGHAQEFFAVHHRAGQPCPACKTPIQQITLGGRSTYFCPSCQQA